MSALRGVLKAAVQDLLGYVPIPRLDAELLACYVLKIDRLKLLLTDEIGEEQITLFSQLVQKRKLGKPIAYIIRSKDFWRQSFYVDENCLIPRPETELLVEIASSLPTARCAFADFGCGTGCIALSIVEEMLLKGLVPQAILIDKSPQALRVARKNAARLGLQKYCRFILGDFLHLPRIDALDFIVSNPPYIQPCRASLPKSVLRFEPHLALFAPLEVRQYYKALIACAAKHVRTGGFVIIETDPTIKNLDSIPSVRLLQKFNDLQGLERALLFRVRSIP